MRWIETDKGDPRCRELADRHYTRIKIGHPMWTRPGWNQILYTQQQSKPERSASFCWFRPKWESGILGTERKDKLRAIECSIFRNETRYRSSDLIVQAIAALLSWEHATDVEYPDGIITGVSTTKTRGGRAAGHEAGHCFREAGFVPFDHPGRNAKADVWLRYAGPAPVAVVPAQSERLVAKLAAQATKRDRDTRKSAGYPTACPPHAEKITASCVE